MSEFAKTLSGPIVTINKNDIDRLKELAKKSDKNRFRYCAHETTDHPVQEMFICAKGHSYLPPHKHPPGKCESYHAVEGRADIYLMDDNGQVIDMCPFGEGNGDARFFRISAPIYHFVFPRSDWFIYHEVYSGPWTRETSVIPAPFAPDENNADAVARFIKRVTGFET